MNNLPKYPLLVKRTHREIAVTLDTRIEGEIGEVFDFIAAEDVLPKVLTGYSPFRPLSLLQEIPVPGIHRGQRGWFI